MTTHFMVDLETLGNSPNAPVFDIGVVHFDPQAREILGHTEIAVRITESDGIDPSTVAWWMQQSEPARLAAASKIETGQRPEAAYAELSRFIHDRCPSRREVRVWGNGATFDNVILDARYRKLGITPAWTYSGHRCFRTLVNLLPSKVEGVERVGVYHSGLDDAMYQTNVLLAAMDRLGLKELY